MNDTLYSFDQQKNEFDNGERWNLEKQNIFNSQVFKPYSTYLGETALYYLFHLYSSNNDGTVSI